MNKFLRKLHLKISKGTSNDIFKDDCSLLEEFLYNTKSINCNNLEKDYYLFGINKNNKKF
jgi:hypothetical protein